MLTSIGTLSVAPAFLVQDLLVARRSASMHNLVLETLTGIDCQAPPLFFLSNSAGSGQHLGLVLLLERSCFPELSSELQ